MSILIDVPGCAYVYVRSILALDAHYVEQGRPALDYYGQELRSMDKHVDTCYMLILLLQSENHNDNDHINNKIRMIIILIYNDNNSNNTT